MMRRAAVVFLVLFAVSSCGFFRSSPGSGNVALWGSRTPKVALILSGGAARGFAHAGVIRALEREKIPIDLIVGVNTGSLIGAIYADRKNAVDLEKIVLTLEERDIFDYSFINPTQGFVRGDRLEDFVAKKISSKEINQLRVPFAAVASDLQNGEVVILQSGSIARAVHASNAIPGIFSPVSYQGKLLVDGGVLNNVPVDVAKKIGADVVIAVDLGGPAKDAQAGNIFETTVQSFYLAARQNAEAKLKLADVVIRPKVSDVGLNDFTRKKELLNLGAEAAAQALPAIRAKMRAK
ncbi:MAG TPA: patatin-like phospholipase family protein [Candidatus Binatia bacterium]